MFNKYFEESTNFWPHKMIIATDYKIKLTTVNIKAYSRNINYATNGTKKGNKLV